MPVYVFDFDGVLAASTHDLIYRMPVDESETEWLNRACDFFKIAPDKDPTFTRHIVLQQWLVEGDVVPEAGPMLSMVSDLQKNRTPWYLLTARSVPAAQYGCFAFLDEHRIMPNEMFCVGRAGKVAQLKYLAEQTTDTVIYYDDSQVHVDAANALGLPNLKVHKVEPVNRQLNAQRLYDRMRNDINYWMKND